MWYLFEEVTARIDPLLRAPAPAAPGTAAEKHVTLPPQRARRRPAVGQLLRLLKWGAGAPAARRLQLRGRP